MIDPMAGWSLGDRAGAIIALMVITFAPLKIIEKLNKIIALLERIDRKN